MGFLWDEIAALKAGAVSMLATLLSHQARHNGGADPIPVATDLTSGLMAATDKAHLDSIGTVFVFKGFIGVAADFPVPPATINWLYVTTAQVTDNNPAKTNTGQTFSSGAQIIWNGTNWTQLDVDRLEIRRTETAVSMLASMDDEMIVVTDCAAPRVVTLPTSALAIDDKVYIVKNATDVSGALTVVGQAGELMDGQATTELAGRESVWFSASGTGWDLL